MDLVPTQKHKLLNLIRHVKQNDMSSVIEEMLQNTTSKEDEADSDDTNQTVCSEQVYDYDSDSTSSNGMAIDKD
jgi:hypothetical protein